MDRRSHCAHVPVLDPLKRTGLVVVEVPVFDDEDIPHRPTSFAQCEQGDSPGSSKKNYFLKCIRFDLFHFFNENRSGTVRIESIASRLSGCRTPCCRGRTTAALVAKQRYEKRRFSDKNAHAR